MYLINNNNKSDYLLKKSDYNIVTTINIKI